jgi:hypothetical protein
MPTLFYILFDLAVERSRYEGANDSNPLHNIRRGLFADCLHSIGSPGGEV